MGNHSIFQPTGELLQPKPFKDCSTAHFYGRYVAALLRGHVKKNVFFWSFRIPVQNFQSMTCFGLWIMFGCVCIACMDEHLAPLHSSLLVPFAPFHHANFSLSACYCRSGCRRCRNHVGTCLCGPNSSLISKSSQAANGVRQRKLKTTEEQ